MSVFLSSGRIWSKKNPIASNETDKGRQMNRRVEIQLNLDNS
jgi:outer membrane protein OmpA-like peptidoglycan-associated protein